MDRFEALKAFVAVAEHRSFAEAARTLRISPTAASRAIADLEQALGVTLLRRTTRSVGLTPEGATYLQRCRIALDELDDAERSLRGENAEPRGELIVTAPVVFGRMHILPIVTKLLRAHPQLNVNLTLVDRVIRLVEEGIDVAVRIADLSDSSLHVVRLAEVRRVLVANPTYLADRGVPSGVSDLLKHNLIVFDNFATNGEWRFTESGRPAIRCEPRLLTNSVEAAIDAALEGTRDCARSLLSGRRSRSGRSAALCVAAVRSASSARQSIVPGEPPRIAQCTSADRGSAGVLPFRSDHLLSDRCRIRIDLQRCSFNPTGNPKPRQVAIPRSALAINRKNPAQRSIHEDTSGVARGYGLRLPNSPESSRHTYMIWIRVSIIPFW